MPMVPGDRPHRRERLMSSISPLPGSGFISVLRPSAPAPAPPAGAVTTHRMLPRDPLDQHLTDGDRSAIKTATGAGHESDGSILYPLSMSTDDRSAVSRTVGQIAAARANGRLSGDLSADRLSALLRQQGYRGSGATPAADQGPGPGVDLLA